MNMVKRFRHAGFTLIELIIVITIVAILAAMALPRFIDAQRDARVAKTNAIFGSVRTAAMLAKSRCELDNSPSSNVTNPCNPKSNSSNVLMEGAGVSMVYGYPAGTLSGIEVAAQINVTSDGLSRVISGTGLYYNVTGGTDQTCSIYYTPAVSATGTVTAPVATVDTTGC